MPRVAGVKRSIDLAMVEIGRFNTLTVVKIVDFGVYLEYITDSDLNNYASITGIKVDALLSPVLSVKDTKNTYKGGTTAVALVIVDLYAFFT